MNYIIVVVVRHGSVLRVLVKHASASRIVASVAMASTECCSLQCSIAVQTALLMCILPMHSRVQQSVVQDRALCIEYSRVYYRAIVAVRIVWCNA